MPSIDQLVARDGPNCCWCGQRVKAKHRTREHLIPVAHGGTNQDHNLAMACRTCNHERGLTPVGTWLAAMRDALANPVAGEHPAKTARSRLRPAAATVKTKTKPWASVPHQVSATILALGGAPACDACGLPWPCPTNRGVKPTKAAKQRVNLSYRIRERWPTTPEPVPEIAADWVPGDF